jgi:hypothetical protein
MLDNGIKLNLFASCCCCQRTFQFPFIEYLHRTKVKRTFMNCPRCHGVTPHRVYLTDDNDFSLLLANYFLKHVLKD